MLLEEITIDLFLSVVLSPRVVFLHKSPDGMVRCVRQNVCACVCLNALYTTHVLRAHTQKHALMQFIRSIHPAV